MPISLENLIKSFKLRRTMKEMRRHRGYLAHAKSAGILEYSMTQL
jgi:hypothetical protein